MKKLLTEYQNFLNSNLKTNEAFYSKLKDGQSPDTLFITCSDSRICPNEVTGTKAGELFVIRNAGNTVPTEKNARGTSEGLTVEYAVTQLKVKQIVVCGHAYCGAMNAILGFDSLPSELTMIRAGLEDKLYLRDELKNYKTQTAESEVDRLIELNVIKQMENLNSYSFVKDAVNKNELKIFGWIYDFSSGKLKHKEYSDSHFEITH